MTPEDLARVIDWAASRPWPKRDSDVPYWISQLDAILRQYCGATGRPCVEAAWKADPEFRATEGRFEGRCNHRTAAAVWAAAVGEFRRIAEQHINQETTCRV